MPTSRRSAPVAAILFAVYLAAAVPGQTCGAGETLLKNDTLPAVPQGAYRYGVVSGLCQGEAAMSYFAYGTPCEVRSVSVLFGHSQGTNGSLAAVDVEIYDGATFGAGGSVTLGPLLFKLSNGGPNLQLRSTAINTHVLNKPVFVPSGNPVIGFRMILNASSGSCASGYSANFSVDAAGTCNGGRNILDTTNYGIFDPAVFKVPPFQIPFCPSFFNGSWVIRACVRPSVSVTWTGNATPGGIVSFTLNAPNQANNGYYLVMSGGNTGWQSPWGRLPVDYDPIFDCFLGPCAATLVNRSGTINANGQGFSGLVIPNSPILKNSGLTLYAAFVTFKPPNFLPWVSTSSASLPIVINRP